MPSVPSAPPHTAGAGRRDPAPGSAGNSPIYDGGLHESLVIEIGEGKGDNYFCILYPSLCMIDYENREENTNYKSKIMELFDNIF